MKKLEDYKEQKIAIHFPTYELWLRRKEINPSDDCGNYWGEEEQVYGIYYCPFSYNYTGRVLRISQKSEYIIINATDFLEDFLEEEFIYGQEYEFSDNNNFKNKSIRKFIAKSTCGKYFITWSENSPCSGYYKYARKINTERTEAITTIKELVSKFSINQNEVF